MFSPSFLLSRINRRAGKGHKEKLINNHSSLIILIKYSLPFYLPVCLDRVFVAPVLLTRRVWYGYAFRRIKLANCDKYAIVDPSDFAELSKYTWWADYSYGSYRIIRLVPKGRGHTAVQMHRQIMADELARAREKSKVKLYIDHKNGNSRDNRRANLRIATHLQNARNRVKINKKCSSIYKGVCRHKYRKSWMCQINVGKKSVHLGYFDDEVEAARAYDKAAKKYHKEFACLNFPPPDKKGLKNLIKFWFGHR